MFEQIAWIVIINLALYFRTLRFKFVSDDFSVYHNPPPFKNKWHKRWLQFIGACKLKTKAPTFFWNKGLKMVLIETEEEEHFLALLIHIAICISIFFAFGANEVSFVASLLYSTNPVNNQGTIWPGGRGYALPILCILLSMCVPILSPAFLYFSAWFTVGFLSPLALLGHPLWFVLAAMPIIWFLHSKKFKTAVGNKASKESFKEDKLSFHPKKFILAIKTFGFYLSLCLIPFRITFYHNFLQSAAGCLKHKAYTPWDRYFWIGLVSGLGILAYSWLNWGPLAWALMAFMLTIAPFCNFVRANQEIAERFAALPNVFLMFALAQVIAPNIAIVCAFLAFYATRTYYTLGQYRDEYFITEQAIIEDPHAWWAWHCRAMKRWDTQSYRESLILWTMARLISPKEFKVLMNLATCLRLLKQDKEADEFLRQAEENMVEGQEEEARCFIAEHRSGKLPILL